MISLRSIARAAPRALPRASASVAGITLRQHMAQRAPLLRPAAIASHLLLAPSSPFSTSAACQKGGRPEQEDVSYELVSKIDHEILFEDEASEKEQIPSSIKDFLENSSYTLHDTPGEQMVKLTRDFKGEKITVKFSVSDSENLSDLYNEEDSLDDEGFDEVETYSTADKQRGTPSRPAIEDGPAEDEESLDDNNAEDENTPPPPLRLTVIIEKPGRASGALCIEALCEHSNISIGTMTHYSDASVPHGESPDAIASQHWLYPGPPFETLDEDLQNVIDTFLHERGINQAMAIFAADYVGVKDHQEYIRWLKNIRQFISA